MVAPGSKDGVVLGRFQRKVSEGRVECLLCPRNCQLQDGQQGFCGNRECCDGAIRLTTYGRPSGFCIDPVEKKPLFHFFPGTSILSFGTRGCNLACRFCQNWEISRANDSEEHTRLVEPTAIAETARAWGCPSVAFTYNDPVAFAEYAIDTAIACRARNVHTVAVTAGYIGREARKPFFEVMDAANVDLKAIRPGFYRRLCSAELDVVKDNLRYLVRETSVWVELTTLLIPSYNDSPDEIAELARWVCGELGPDVPLHFTAFHPSHRMLDVPSTPKQTCQAARESARAIGLKHVYTGNVNDPTGQASYCSHCSEQLLGRHGYEVDTGRFVGGRCTQCGTALSGRFGSGGVGDFGSRRIPIAVPSVPGRGAQ
jgi:pyruvate formate lyase activating enzyme